MQPDHPLPPGLPAANAPPAPRVSAREIGALADRVRLARDGARRAGPAPDVEVLLEELGVAEEELRIQNDEIAESNARLLGAQERYRELFDLAPDAYLVTDVAGRIDEANHAASTLLAVDPARLHHKPLIAYVVEPGRRAFRTRLAQVAERRERATLALTIRGRDGRLADVAAVLAPIEDARGEVVGFRWLLRDVTEERAAQRENDRLSALLEVTVAERTAALRATLADLQAAHDAQAEASARKSEFLAFLSHEVRTPLQAIIGYTELLSLDIHGPLTDAQRADVERMQRGQQHILRLVDGMLDYARVESGRVELDIARVALADVCEVAIDLVRPLAHAANVTIACDTAGLAVRADAEKARQVVINLLGNALKFGPPGGRVTVAAHRDRDAVVLTVADEGAPIPHRLRELIFEPYVHPHRTTEGTGLGLPISRRRARALGGDLVLADEDVPGNRFELRLPAT